MNIEHVPGVAVGTQWFGTIELLAEVSAKSTFGFTEVVTSAKAEYLIGEDIYPGLAWYSDPDYPFTPKVITVIADGK